MSKTLYVTEALHYGKKHINKKIIIIWYIKAYQVLVSSLAWLSCTNWCSIMLAWVGVSAPLIIPFKLSIYCNHGSWLSKPYLWMPLTCQNVLILAFARVLGQPLSLEIGVTHSSSLGWLVRPLMSDTHFNTYGLWIKLSWTIQLIPIHYWTEVIYQSPSSVWHHDAQSLMDGHAWEQE